MKAAVFTLLLALLVCLWGLPGAPASAQQLESAAPMPAVRDSQGVGAVVEQSAGPYIPVAKERYRLFVFGDKMATGLLAGIWRVLKNDPQFLARGRFHAGSGLARMRYYDWQRAIAQVLNSQPVDIGVVMLGVDDVRDILIRDRRIPFGSDEWKGVYASRVDAIIQTFRDNRVALYWVGLPPVRDRRLNAGVKLINELLRERMHKQGVRFIDIYDRFAGPDGGFVFEGPDVEGRVARLRARNGIYFIRAGNTRLAKIVMDVIRRDVEEARARPLAPGAVGVSQSDKPFVGNAGPDGRPIFVPPARLPGRNVVYLAPHRPRARTAHNVLMALRDSAAPGSPARRLFVEGLWPIAPAGRIDDFRLPTPATDRAGAQSP